MSKDIGQTSNKYEISTLSFSSMEKIRKRSRTPIRLKAMSKVTALTTALARPLVHALGIEFHQEDVSSARVGVPIQGATRVACHPGIANGVHLRKDRQLSFAVRRRCACKLKEKLREKPISLGKNEVKINDNAKTMKNYEKL